MAAFSTTRALFGHYGGPLYRVRRLSNGASINIPPVRPGGVADSARQGAFCAHTSCVITEIFDQSRYGNNLTVAGAGGAAKHNDLPASATAAPAKLGGHEVYGIHIAPGDGYRDDRTKAIPTGDAAEGEYAVLDGKVYNNGCCFDFGNAETSNQDNGKGHMEAIYFGTAGSGGRELSVRADLENGLYPTQFKAVRAYRFITAMLEGKPGRYAIRSGNAGSGGLTVDFSGYRPKGYETMHKEGAIILGIGGDNSDWDTGTFYEGVMTRGYPSAAAQRAVQVNIVSAGYRA